MGAVGGQDDAANGVVLGSAIECRVERVEHRLVLGVARLGPREDDSRDALTGLLVANSSTVSRLFRALLAHLQPFLSSCTRPTLDRRMGSPLDVGNAKNRAISLGKHSTSPARNLSHANPK